MEQVKQHISARSRPLYNRMIRHRPESLLPSKVTAISTQDNGGFRYLRVSDGGTAGRGRRQMLVALVKENNAIKVDLPETFRKAFGEDWPHAIDMIETGYMFAKSHLGEKESKEALEMLIQNYQ